LRLCIFEDRKYKDLYPLTYTRPVFDLRCGMTRIREKIERNFPASDTAYFMRSHLGPAFKDELHGTVNSIESIMDDDVFFANGRLLAWKGFLKQTEDEVVALKGGDVVYASAKRETLRRSSASNIGDVLDKLKAELSPIDVDADLVEHPWDLVRTNPRAIVDDFESIGRHGVFGKMSARAEIWGEAERVYVAETAEIHPFVVLDTHGGPIMIDEKVRIFPFSRIEGPCTIGSGSVIVRGNVREEVTIGPVCRVGGEVESSIIHGYSNKYHTGFLGHAYVGEWVNIGALTTNSDLKNDYSNVEVYVDGRLVDTGDTKVGSFIGDHTKLGIGCLLNTGTVVGVACNLLGGEVLPKYVPSFSWFARGRISRGSGFRRTVEAERRVMARRNVEMSQSHVDILQRIYDETREDRENLIKRSKAKAMSDA
jgi:UDP-N-acetylglucosamine diphosphorylase/glucosamine-1-phosphate N-acetyltransferase